MNEQRLSVLVERYLDRDATAAETSELQASLRDDAEARMRFWEAVEWHALFRQWGEQEWGRKEAKAQSPVSPIPSAPRPPSRTAKYARAKEGYDRKIVRFPFARWAAGIAAAAAVVLLFLAIQSPAPVASIDRVASAVWSSKKLTPGTRLTPGRLQLKEGAVVIAFDRGARVVVEGPADFEVRGDNSLALHAGRVRARVPASAHGFSLETPQFTAVDIGTEFGCDVALNGVGELHVFAGKVDLLPGDSRTAAVQLSENQAMRINGSLVTPLPARPLSFAGEDDLVGQELRAKGDFLGAWGMASRQLNQSPATVLHFDFEKASGSLVSNRAHRAGPRFDATFVGCQPAEGRWPGKGALTFKNARDRMEFALPGQFESLTLFAWVRVASVHTGQNPLVMGRADRGPGAVHWYIYGRGALGLGVLSKTNETSVDWNTFHSEPVLEPHHLGSWIFVASVFDGAAGIATHYLNGKPVASKAGIVRGLLQLAVTDVGNHAPGLHKPGEPPPNFDGTIDELAVLSTALTAQDVARLYRQGQP